MSVLTGLSENIGSLWYTVWRFLQYAGGVFCKLEAQWRAAYMQQQAKQQAQAQLRYAIFVVE